MMSKKLGLILLGSSASLAIMLLSTSAVRSETINEKSNSQSVEIVKQQSSQINDEANLGEEYWLNDDKIGDAAIARFGCDCANHRRTIAQTLQSQLLQLMK